MTEDDPDQSRLNKKSLTTTTTAHLTVAKTTTNHFGNPPSVVKIAFAQFCRPEVTIRHITRSEQPLQQVEKKPCRAGSLRANPLFRRPKTAQPTHSPGFSAETSAKTADPAVFVRPRKRNQSLTISARPHTTGRLRAGSETKREKGSPGPSMSRPGLETRPAKTRPRSGTVPDCRNRFADTPYGQI